MSPEQKLRKHNSWENTMIWVKVEDPWAEWPVSQSELAKKMVGREAGSGLWCGAATNVGTPKKIRQWHQNIYILGMLQGFTGRQCVCMRTRSLEMFGEISETRFELSGVDQGYSVQTTSAEGGDDQKPPAAQRFPFPSLRFILLSARVLLFESSGSGVTIHGWPLDSRHSHGGFVRFPKS